MLWRHYLGRQLIARGLTVKLMPPEYVRPYVKAQKNDDRDAEGIAEAATRPTMRFVELKSQEQLDIQSLHRVRSRLVGSRTTLTNQMRALLLERGVTIAQGRRKFERAIDAMLADEAQLGIGRLRDLLLDMRAEWSALDRRIDGLDQEFIQLARTDEVARWLTSIPGVGALNATALESVSFRWKHILSFGCRRRTRVAGSGRAGSRCGARCLRWCALLLA